MRRSAREDIKFRLTEDLFNIIERITPKKLMYNTVSINIITGTINKLFKTSTK